MPTVFGVIFDMDGVLCDSEPFIRAAAMQMFENVYGLKVQPEDFHPFVGAGEDRFIGGVADKYGVKLVMPRDKLHTYEIYLRIIQDQLRPLPGAVQFIQHCRDRGLKLAVASTPIGSRWMGTSSRSASRRIGLMPSSAATMFSGKSQTRRSSCWRLSSFLCCHRTAWWWRMPPMASAPPRPPARCAWGSRRHLTTPPSCDGADVTAADLAHTPPDLPF